MHVVRHTPEPIDLIDCDDEVIQTSGPEQLRRMVTHWKQQAEERQRLKREWSESETVAGDQDEVESSEDVVIMGAVDLRKERRKRQKPTQTDEVIVLD